MARGYGLAPVTGTGRDGAAVDAVERRASLGGVLAVVLFAGLAVVALTTVVYRQSKDSSTAPAKTNTVVMAQIAFKPDTLTVAKGTEVVWENKDLAPHDVTADNPKISSGTLAPGKTFRLVVQQPFEYRCTIHPGMDAKIALAG
jgi:plastocyanin